MEFKVIDKTHSTQSNMNRIRRLRSIKEELLTKSKEAMLNAVQTFNNPTIQFKSETFIVLSIIAWTYLLHAYYRSRHIEYRYFKVINKRKIYEKTRKKAFKFWDLEKCLDTEHCPLDSITKTNLKFLIGLRHEIEHQMTTRIDEYLSARLQACCLNFNQYIKQFFGEANGIDKYLSFSLQFSTLTEAQSTLLRKFTDLPTNISTYITDFDEILTEGEYNDIKYSYRVLYVPKAVNHKGQADKVIEFIPANSPEAETLNREYVIVKERERTKHLPSEIWESMKQKGYKRFGAYQHTLLWQSKNAKDPSLGYGTKIAKTWYWYDKWLMEVENHCKESGEKYK